MRLGKVSWRRLSGWKSWDMTASTVVDAGWTPVRDRFRAHAQPAAGKVAGQAALTCTVTPLSAALPETSS